MLEACGNIHLSFKRVRPAAVIRAPSTLYSPIARDPIPSTCYRATLRIPVSLCILIPALARMYLCLVCFGRVPLCPPALSFTHPPLSRSLGRDGWNDNRGAMPGPGRLPLP